MASGKIESLTMGKLMYKRVPVTADILGTSFSPESKLVGNTVDLFGIPADHIISIWTHNLSLLPNAVLMWGSYTSNIYVSASLQCTGTYNGNPYLTILYWLL